MNAMSYSVHPIFETRRLLVRPWWETDAETLFKYASEPEVGERAGWPPHQSVDESLSVIRDIFSNDHTWALEAKFLGEAVGCICYYDQKESNVPIGKDDAELGYWIGKPFWNQGLATEAVRGMIRYCFEKKGFHTLWGGYFADNAASGRVLEKCGFRDMGKADGNPVRIMRLDRI